MFCAFISRQSVHIHKYDQFYISVIYTFIHSLPWSNGDHAITSARERRAPWAIHSAIYTRLFFLRWKWLLEPPPQRWLLSFHSPLCGGHGMDWHCGSVFGAWDHQCSVGWLCSAGGLQGTTLNSDARMDSFEFSPWPKAYHFWKNSQRIKVQFLCSADQQIKS